MSEWCGPSSIAGRQLPQWPLPGARTHTHIHARTRRYSIESRARLGALRHCIFLLQSFSKLQKTHLAVDRHAHRTLPLANAVLTPVTDWSAGVSLAGHELCPLRSDPPGKNHSNKKLLVSSGWPHRPALFLRRDMMCLCRSAVRQMWSATKRTEVLFKMAHVRHREFKVH